MVARPVIAPEVIASGFLPMEFDKDFIDEEFVEDAMAIVEG